ncbi:MAG: GNAT family N-acetyltransferase [Defluviitaleaceae bacterium]|nr:GNAT family N-acetyltransferase [Defluviitaleaceae bacterium]
MLKHVDSSNVEICAKIYTDVFNGDDWQYDWVTLDGTLRYFSDLIATPGFVGFVFFEDGESVGCCMGCVSDYYAAPAYDIKEFCVKTNRQHSGVGTRMLAEIENFLIARAVTCVTLMTDKNIPAYNFYLKNNYSLTEANVHLHKMLSV